MRRFIIEFFLLFVLSLYSLLGYSVDLTPALKVFERVAPWMCGKVEVIPLYCSDGSQDAYELSTCGGKLLIKATSVPAAGMGFNHYLKYYCNRNYSLTGINMAPVGELPSIDGSIYHSTNCKYRHFMNFCAQNYSGAFWTFEDWEKVIDFMVLNGVNLTLATVGLEQVWYNVLKKMNFSDEEIFSFLPGPAYNAWHMMANLEGWGGPITLRMIEKRCMLEKKILTRLRECGINPIFMAFYGMVPKSLKEKFPLAQIIPQGKWAGGFERPSILLPMDSLYDEMSALYYNEVKSLYGEFNYFAGEPFHEGGIRKGIDDSELSRKVLDTMRKYNPKAIWVLQGWSGNPTSNFLSSLSKEKDVLIWDFRGELVAEWEQRKGYEGYPFLWGVINNFGETPGLYGRLERFMNEYFRAANGLYSKNMLGLGVSPEGILNNPVNYDFLFEMPWHKNRYNMVNWLDSYVKYRYGKQNEAMKRVWHILFETAYSSNVDSVNIEPKSQVLPSIVGNGESLICASPSLDIQSTSSWGTNFIFYDRNKMKELIPFLIEACNDFGGVDAFQYDLINISRQLLSNEFKTLYSSYQKYYSKSCEDSLDFCSKKMLDIMDDMDLLLSTRKDFMVGHWINAARDFGTNKYEVELAEWNARSLISYWGPDDSSTDLRDYAHKEWAGLIKDLYKPRWIAFFDYIKKSMHKLGGSLPDYTQMSIDWSCLDNVYPNEPVDNPIDVARKILNKLYVNCNF